MKYKILKIRRAKKISQYKLESLSNVTLQTINRIEKGLANPTMYTLESIAKGLGCRVSDLLDE